MTTDQRYTSCWEAQDTQDKQCMLVTLINYCSCNSGQNYRTHKHMYSHSYTRKKSMAVHQQYNGYSL